MTFGLLFVLVSALLFAGGLLLQGAGWLLVWPAVAVLVVALGYLGLGARVFGKRPDGCIAWPYLLWLLPFFVAAWIVWRVRAFVRREEDCYNACAPGLYVGRRATGKELPHDASLVVDMTAEFPEARGVRTNRRYLCCPTLDTGVPDIEKYKEAVRETANHHGAVYVHCASGHGRAPLLAAGVMLTKGMATDPDDAIAKMQAARPKVRLKHAQRQLLMRVAPEL